MIERELTPHPDEQRSYSELRSEFRSASLANLRSQYSGHHPLGWLMIGDSATARDKYTAEQWLYEMDRHLCDPVSQYFGLDIVPASFGVRLERWAQESMDEITFPAGTEGTYEHDGPACCDLGGMTDEQLCDYVDQAIKESDRG